MSEYKEIIDRIDRYFMDGYGFDWCMPNHAWDAVLEMLQDDHHVDITRHDLPERINEWYKHGLTAVNWDDDWDYLESLKDDYGVAVDEICDWYCGIVSYEYDNKTWYVLTK